MPLTAKRALRIFKYAMYFDGVSAYVTIPLTVYGWSEITIQEWIYPFQPKANIAYSSFSMIGDVWTDYPSTYLYTTENTFAYRGIVLIFVTRTADGKRKDYGYIVMGYNTWFNFARRFELSTRVLTYFLNGSRAYSYSIPSTEYTVLEWDPSRATYPERYRRFVLGASTILASNMKMMQYQLLIYTRALSDSEVQWNYQYPDNPIRNGLILWLKADPAYVKDIDSDGVLEWVDLSGFGNHGKIYGAQLVQLIKTPARTLTPARVLKAVR